MYNVLYYWSGAVLLHCTRLHCSDLQWTAGFIHTLHPAVLTYTEFCALDCTAPTCIEHAMNCRVLSYTLPYWTDLHSILMNCTSMRCAGLHWTALHCTALRCAAQHCTALHCTTLHCNAPHCTALHCTSLQCTALHCTALQCIALH